MTCPPHDANQRSFAPHPLEEPASAPPKRSLVSDDAIDSVALRALIEGEIIPRLLASHGVPVAAQPHRAAAAAERRSDVDAFADLAISADLEDLLAFIDARRRDGLGADDVFSGILAPAARRLGVYWEQDICSFTDVTVALGKLHQVVHRLGGPVQRRQESARYAPTILMSPFPGEQHVLGIAIVAEAFRDGGWNVTEDWDASETRLLDQVRHTRYDAIGLTVSSDVAMDALPALIAALRRASANRSLVVLVGGWRFSENPALALKCGADATADSPRLAVKRAGELLDAHAARV